MIMIEEGKIWALFTFTITEAEIHLIMLMSCDSVCGEINPETILCCFAIVFYHLKLIRSVNYIPCFTWSLKLLPLTKLLTSSMYTCCSRCCSTQSHVTQQLTACFQRRTIPTSRGPAPASFEASAFLRVPRNLWGFSSQLLCHLLPSAQSRSSSNTAPPGHVTTARTSASWSENRRSCEAAEERRVKTAPG